MDHFAQETQSPEADLLEADAMAESLNTIFYLVGHSKEAKAAIADPQHRHLLVETHTYGMALRITLDSFQEGCLVQIRNGRDGSGAGSGSTIALRGTRQDIHCRFFFNGSSGELLLRDESRRRTATLKQLHGSTAYHRAIPKVLKARGQHQCAVVLRDDPSSLDSSTASYELTVASKFVFHIRPPLAHFPADPADKAPFFVRDGLDMHWPPPGAQTLVGFTTIEELGSGAEDCVQLVAVGKTGIHIACRTYCLKNKDRHEQVVGMLNILMRKKDEVSKSYIVPCLHYQQPRMSEIEVFMPIYWCSLADLIDGGCFQDPETSFHMAARMLLDIATALACLQSLEGGVVHRNVNPDSILYANGQFYLKAFESAKKADKTHTIVGAAMFQSPEARKDLGYSPAMDVFGLGLTLVACTMGIRPLAEIWSHDDSWQNWVAKARGFISNHLAVLGPAITAMLQDDPVRRPRARDVRSAVNAYLKKHEHLRGTYQMPDKKLAKQLARERRDKLASTAVSFSTLKEKPYLRSRKVMSVGPPPLEKTVDDLIQAGCFRDPSQAQYLTSRMIHDISGALCRLHSANPRLPLNTIRPSRILYKDMMFRLADPFSQTHTETWTDDIYSPPEPSDSSIPGPKDDIYALGMTTVVCLASLSSFQIQWLSKGNLDAWRSIADGVISGRLTDFAPSVKTMLARNPSDRADPALLLRELQVYIQNDRQKHLWPTVKSFAAAEEIRASRAASVVDNDEELVPASEIIDLGNLESEAGNLPHNVPAWRTGTESVPDTVPCSSARSFYSAVSVQAGVDTTFSVVNMIKAVARPVVKMPAASWGKTARR